MKNTEQETAYGLITIVIWQRFGLVSSSFFFFSLISINFLHYTRPEPLPQPPFTPIYREKWHLGAMAARPSKLMLTPEVIGSHKRATARPGELVPSALSNLGAQACQRLAQASQGPENSLKRPFCPSLFGNFCILDQNIEQSFVLCNNQCRTTQFGQRESKYQ